MAFVVTDACINCKYTDCVEECPTDSFREGKNMLVIDPDACIHCFACMPVCPANAIFPQEDLPEGKKHFAEINAAYAKVWPEITEKKEPLPGADEAAKQEGKETLLDPSGA